MKRVTLVARPATGGIRTHVIEMIARLPRNRWLVGIAAPPAFMAGLPDGLPNFDPIPCTITAQASPSDFAAADILRRSVRKQLTGSVGIIHAHGIRAGFVAALANRGRRFPLIVTYHNVPPDSALAQFILRFIVSRSSASIAVSSAIASRISPSAHVIPNGIDLGKYGTLDRKTARVQFGLADDRIVVVCASRLSPEKGIRYLISAAEALPEVTFLIAGDGPKRFELSSAAGDNVRLLGRIESIPALLSAADIACVPSLTEGQGIFALEAMAAGLPVVASNVGGLPEMIADGVTGLLIRPGDSLSIANAIRRLTNSVSLRSTLGEAAKAKARNSGDIDAMLARIEEVYNEVNADDEA